MTLTAQDRSSWKRRAGPVVRLDKVVGREEELLMKKPTLRVTKWLGDIPVEAYCTACPTVAFRAQGSSHRPTARSTRDLFNRNSTSPTRRNTRILNHEAERERPSLSLSWRR